MLLREALAADETSILEIMNQAILDQKNAYLSRFDNEHGRVWFNGLMDKGLIVLVVVLDDVICGWGALTPYREGRGALSQNVEITFYVHERFKRRGVASMLIKDLEKRAKQLNKSQSVAILLDDNKESKTLLKKAGYQILGYFPDIASFQNKVCGHLYMWKALL